MRTTKGEIRNLMKRLNDADVSTSFSAEAVWGEMELLRSELEEQRTRLVDIYDALQLMVDLYLKLPWGAETKEQRQYRKGFRQALASAQENAAEALEVEDNG